MSNDKGNTGVIPAHLKTTDFTVYNSTPETMQLFQIILDHLQQNSPTGTALIGQQYLNGTSVVINPLDGVIGNNVPDHIRAEIKADPGRDHYDPATNAIYINPYSALQVKDGAGNIIGINSVADAYAHEVSHSIDPLSIEHLIKQPTDGYPNVGEWLSGQYEKMVSRELHEVERTNHNGDPVLVDNPTTSTMQIDGTTYWVKTNADGNVEVGQQYDFKKIEANWDVPGSGPKFGSPDPGHATDFNHPSPHDENGGTEIYTPPSGNDQDNNEVGILMYDSNGNPYIVHNPEVPSLDDPNAHVVLLDPHNGSNGDPNDPDGNGEASGNDDGGSDGTDIAGGQGGDDWGNGSGENGGGSDNYGCVAVESFLPGDGQAGAVVPDDTMQLGDERTLAPATGRVSYSQEKTVPGSRIVTEFGATLRCSDTANLPVRDRGLMTPEDLAGEWMGIRRDHADGSTTYGWEKVIAVEKIGLIRVQHITCENKCFWAGEQKGIFLLHHNMKMIGGGGGGGDGDGGGEGDFWFFDDKANITRVPSDGPATPHHVDLPGAHVVGVPPPMDGGPF